MVCMYVVFLFAFLRTMAEEEAAERCQAEVDFVASAYGEEEAWAVMKSSGYVVSRRLILTAPASSGAEFVVCHVILTITMPEDYPVREDAVLGVDAYLCNDSSSSSSSASATLRKMVINSLSSLITECRQVAKENAGGEAVFVVLARADEWVSTDWMDIVETTNAEANAENATNLISDQNDTSKPTRNGSSFVLGRRLIHSHHIIARSKRKAIVDLAQDYNLGGCYKYGWPGIIIIEGEEADCMSYVEEIRTLRWQHLVVRGEQQIHVRDRDELERSRVLPSRMQDLGDDMSIIAKQCKEAGLEELFLTSMKIYRDSEKKENGSEKETDSEAGEMNPSFSWRYGALCHVDHMNDAKPYRKWLRKAASGAGCTVLIKVCDANAKRPIIIVIVFAEEEDDIKRFMRRWRTSRVDVDSTGRPCLERMMTVLTEGELDQEHIASFDDIEISALLEGSNISEENLNVSEACLSKILRAFGGTLWADEFASVVNGRKGIACR